MDFDELEQALAQAGAHAGAAECHGTLSGWLASGCGDDPAPWLDPLLEELEPADPRVLQCRDALVALHRRVREQYADLQFAFAPLLPDEQQPLATRIGAMGEWCEGFLYGLGLAGRNAATGGSEVDEVVGDFAQIARAGIDAEGGGEEDEQAYSELVEYLRVAAQLVHDTFESPAPKPRRLH